MWKTPWFRWGAVRGLALGGSFDGILLHQILQRHHLLSLAPGIDDLRLQVLRLLRADAYVTRRSRARYPCRCDAGMSMNALPA